MAAELVETPEDIAASIEALADLDRAQERVPDAKKDQLRMDRAIVLGRLGRHAGALAEADAALRKDGGPASLYRGACVYALSSAALAQDAQLPLPQREKQAEAAAKASLALLERARQAGYFDKPDRRKHVQEDEDLASLRQRPAEYGSSGSTRSMRWCGTAARSAAPGLAVPMSMPR